MNNKFVIHFENNSKFIESIKKSFQNHRNFYNLKIIKVDNQIQLIWDFKNMNIIFNLIKKIDLNKIKKLFLIKTSVGNYIPIFDNDKKEFVMRQNCQVHASINFIIGILYIIENNILLGKNFKEKLQKIIVNQLNNFFKNIKDMEKIYVFKNHEQLSIKEFFEIFHLKSRIEYFTQLNINEILKKGINKENRKLIDFIINIYDVIILFFRGNYSFNHNGLVINVKINDFDFITLFNSLLLNMENNSFFQKNILKRGEYKRNNFFGNFIKNLYKEGFIFKNNRSHTDNLIYLEKNKLNEYINILEELNKQRPNTREKTSKSFTYGIEEIL